MADALQSPLLMAMKRNRLLLQRMDQATVTRLANAYGRVWQSLQGQLKATQEAMDAGKDQAYLKERVLELSRQVEQEVAHFGRYADQELEVGARQAIEAGLKGSSAAVAAAYGPAGKAVVGSYWHALPVDAVEEMAGMLGPQSPLYSHMTSTLGPAVADRVAQGLMEGIALGYNPQKIQAKLEATLGEGLTWAYGQTHTAQIWAYREATRAEYLANSNIVKGWIWHSALNPFGTCLSCLSKHGSFHTNDEVLNDHRRGWCAMMPVTTSWADLGFPDIPESAAPVESGEDYFKKLPDAQQLAWMGPAKYAAWRAGKISFADFPTRYQDDIYGEMTVEASLKGILGRQAEQFYKQKRVA
jgi:hypothetical protein